MTFGEKLARMKADLNSIVTRMNADHSHDVAQAAQSAIAAVAHLEYKIRGNFDDFEWTWRPSKD